MAALSAFTRYIAYEVIGCPQPVMHAAVLQACVEFCTRSRLFTERVSLVTQPDTEVYTPGVAAGRRAARVLWVRRDDVPLAPTTEAIADTVTPASGTPARYYLNAAGQLVLTPIPVESEVLQCKFVLAPAADAADVDDALFADWAQAIAAGARAALMRQKGAPWFDPQKALLDQGVFDACVSTAIARRETGRTNGNLRVAMRPAA